ncbi:hypothetical protein D3Y57_02470 (plasmid) [Sphingomonas paeninsulae]|uniref:Uncharacterized protein n=1 Tax=Sphingomonas paeninsulae TaxID=2319844 RepID=A0A494TC25_SPHPE|nr:hypothetical protein [Sphingomonas paeninsulae]AYJ84942.1 hypothetical protein D3Y57_02470 [Sphingomonas paeninsulae]
MNSSFRYVSAKIDTLEELVGNEVIGGQRELQAAVNTAERQLYRIPAETKEDRIWILQRLIDRAEGCDWSVEFKGPLVAALFDSYKDVRQHHKRRAIAQAG